MEAHHPCPVLNVSSDNDILFMLTQLQISRLLSLFNLMPYYNDLKYSLSSLKGLPLFASIPFLSFFLVLFPPIFPPIPPPPSLISLFPQLLSTFARSIPARLFVPRSWTAHVSRDLTCTEISAQWRWSQLILRRNMQKELNLNIIPWNLFLLACHKVLTTVTTNFVCCYAPSIVLSLYIILLFNNH